MKTQQEMEELLAQCYQNINQDKTNSFATYDEGVRDTLLWLLENTHQPYIGREE